MRCADVAESASLTHPAPGSPAVIREQGAGEGRPLAYDADASPLAARLWRGELSRWKSRRPQPGEEALEELLTRNRRPTPLRSRFGNALLVEPRAVSDRLSRSNAIDRALVAPAGGRDAV